MNKSWKTTLAGVCTILVAVSNAALAYLKTKTLPDWSALLAQIALGWGLIMARDNNVTSEQAGAGQTTKTIPDGKMFPVILLLLAPMALTGCVTSSDGTASIGGYKITPQTVQADIQLAAKIGAREGCKQDKNVEPYLQATVAVLSAALDNGQYDAASLKDALSHISIKEAQTASVAEYVSDALDIYQNKAASQVSGEIDKVKWLRPALTGLRDGIKDGLAQFDALKGQ